jgi:hypothetical protein
LLVSAHDPSDVTAAGGEPDALAAGARGHAALALRYRVLSPVNAERGPPGHVGRGRSCEHPKGTCPGGGASDWYQPSRAGGRDDNFARQGPINTSERAAGCDRRSHRRMHGGIPWQPPRAGRGGAAHAVTAAWSSGRGFAHRGGATAGPGSGTHGRGFRTAPASSLARCAPPIGDPADRAGAVPGSRAAVPMCLCCRWCAYACAWACCGCGMTAGAS